MQDFGNFKMQHLSGELQQRLCRLPREEILGSSACRPRGNANSSTLQLLTSATAQPCEPEKDEQE